MTTGTRVSLRPSDMTDEHRQMEGPSQDDVNITCYWTVYPLKKVLSKLAPVGSYNSNMKKLSAQACVDGEEDETIKSLMQLRHDVDDLSEQVNDFITDAAVDTASSVGFRVSETDNSKLTLRVWNEDVRNRLSSIGHVTNVPAFVAAQMLIIEVIMACKQEKLSQPTRDLFSAALDRWHQWLKFQLGQCHFALKMLNEKLEKTEEKNHA